MLDEITIQLHKRSVEFTSFHSQLRHNQLLAVYGRGGPWRDLCGTACPGYMLPGPALVICHSSLQFSAHFANDFAIGKVRMSANKKWLM